MRRPSRSHAVGAGVGGSSGLSTLAVGGLHAASGLLDLAALVVIVIVIVTIVVVVIFIIIITIVVVVRAFDVVVAELASGRVALLVLEGRELQPAAIAGFARCSACNQSSLLVLPKVQEPHAHAQPTTDTTLSKLRRDFSEHLT